MATSTAPKFDETKHRRDGGRFAPKPQGTVAASAHATLRQQATGRFGTTPLSEAALREVTHVAIISVSNRGAKPDGRISGRSIRENAHEINERRSELVATGQTHARENDFPAGPSELEALAVGLYVTDGPWWS